jgi:hypothetical protein
LEGLVGDEDGRAKRESEKSAKRVYEMTSTNRELIAWDRRPIMRSVTGSTMGARIWVWLKTLPQTA